MAEQKPLLVFLHGWAFGKSIWKDFSKHFEHQFRVMTPDIYDYFPDVKNKLAADIKNTAAGAPIYMIAWSMGYLIALDLAEVLPVTKITALSALPCFTKEHGMKKDTINTMLDGLKSRPERILRKFYQWVYYPERPQKKQELTASGLQLQQSLIYLKDKNKSDSYQTVLTLFLFGAKDTVLPNKALEDFSGIKTYVFPEGNHIFFLNEQQASVAKINQFFKGE